MAVEFRVLGPLEVRRDGAPVPLRAPAQRTFLAALLIQHGRVVSVDSLAEVLWPGEQPRSPRHALEMNASRVRRLLGDDAAVVARPPGYVLEVDPEAIDSVRFERLLAEARELDPARAASRAADALALWRGPPFADFTFAGFAHEEIARLEELRQEAEEERIAAALAAGRSAELIGELEALVAAEPLREQRRAQLMLALYRAGRQADALAVYSDARKRLDDELGLEPGPELRELQRAILCQDPSLDLAVTVRAAAAAERRPASVVAVEPEISLELDPEEHDRQKRKAAEVVARVAEHFDALQPEPFVLAFAHEDHAARAAAAAAALGTRVGIASGDALVGERSVGGPLIDLARRRARNDEPHADAPPLERAPETPFVGRDSELAQLRSARVALVLGPPGIGKSRLLRELEREQPFAIGRCRAYGAEALTPLHELATALGAPHALDGVRADEIPLTVRRLCGETAVAIDDVQWADQLVLDTIEYLASHVRLVCLAREELLEERPTFLAGAERLLLQPLDDSAAAALADGDSEIVARAAGNPLFISQLRLHATESDAPLPTTLHSLLAARLDRLTPSERAAIQRASVIGRDFDAALVDARPALPSLVRRSLLEPAPPTAAYEERFRFAHALIREAAYESIPQTERAHLHEEIADTLEARGGSDEIVGFHLERAAGLWPTRDRHAQRLAEDAGRRLGTAGIAAAKRGDPNGSAALLRRAANLRPDGELLCELGVSVNTLGLHSEAAAVFDRAAEIGDPRVQLRARLERTIVGPVDTAAVAARAEEAIPVFEAMGDDRASGRAWLLLGWARGGAGGSHAQWLDAAERAAAYYVRAGWSPSTCVGHIASALYFGPTPVPDAVARCRELLAEVDDLPGDATVSGYLGGLLAMVGDWDESDALLGRAREIHTDLGRRPSLTRTCAPLEARSARLRGEDERAAEILRAACAELIAEDASFYVATLAAELADMLVDLGDRDDAERWAALAARHLQQDDLAGRISVEIARVRLAGAGGNELVALADRTDNLNARARARLVAGDAEGARELYLQKGNAVAAAAAATAL
jgi:DNA-binding SARP family transcriptional activator